MGQTAPQALVAVPQVDVRTGETLTVWLVVSSFGAMERLAYQVELRVLRDGTPQIFCDEVQCQSHDEWTAVRP